MLLDKLRMPDTGRTAATISGTLSCFYGMCFRRLSLELFASILGDFADWKRRVADGKWSSGKVLLNMVNKIRG